MAGKFSLQSAGGSRPPHLGIRAIVLGGIGGFIAIGTLALLGPSLSVTLLLGSFGASCVLLFGYPDEVASGAVLLVLIAWIYNNATRKTRYPQYW
jgi:CBS-domain-containing membrane protein